MAILVYELNDDKLEPYINPKRARTIAVQMAPSLTVAKGERLGQLTANGKYTKYVSGGTGGAQTAKVISVRAFVTDTAGNVFYGTESALTGPASYAEPTAEVYYTGDFLQADLTGITTGEITDLKATTLGTGADTILRLP